MTRIMMETGGTVYMGNAGIADYALAAVSHLMTMFSAFSLS